MNHIGNIIKYFRKKNNITRENLSKNICSEKYLYMIEKGSRNPSTEILRKFCNRIGVDLFKYFEYLDCIDPISVYKIISQMQYLQIENNVVELNSTIEIASHMPDFSKSPWKYELQINSILYKIFVDEDYDISLQEVSTTLQFLEFHYPSKILIIHFSLLSSTIYLMQKDFKKSLKILASKKSLLENVDTIKHSRLYVSFTIVEYISNFELGYYSVAIELINNLINYQQKNGLYERIYFSLFYLSFCFYQTSIMDKCISTFTDALCMISIFYRPLDVKFLSCNPLFSTILDNQKIIPELAKKIKKMYFS